MESNNLMMVIGTRIGILRNEHKETQQQLADFLGIKREIVAYWESFKRMPKLEHLYVIAEHYDSSVDYLIGKTDIISPNETVQAICKYTGLSDEAVNALNLINQSEIRESRRTINFINMALCDPRLKIKNRLERDFPIETLFSIFDQYVNSSSVKLSKPLQEYDTLSHLISFESSDDMSEVTTVEDIYKQFKLNQIRDGLEELQKQYFGKESK